MQTAVQRRDFVFAALAEGKKVAGLDADCGSGARTDSGWGEKMASPVKSRLMSCIRSDGKDWCLTKVAIVQIAVQRRDFGVATLAEGKMVAGLDADRRSGACKGSGRGEDMASPVKSRLMSYIR